VLRNKYGLHNRAAVTQREYDATSKREVQLVIGQVKLPQTRDAAHLTAVHRTLFQDVYEWAGEYLDIGDLADCAPQDPRLPTLADRVAAFIEAAAAEAVGVEEEHPISDDLIALLDTAFLESFPCAPRLLELLEERGWTGWTNIRRMDPRCDRTVGHRALTGAGGLGRSIRVADRSGRRCDRRPTSCGYRCRTQPGHPSG